MLSKPMHRELQKTKMPARTGIFVTKLKTENKLKINSYVKTHHVL